MDKFNWDDLVPMSIEESETPQLCHILYSDEYKETMGYLKSVMSAQEYSERSLYLTERAILQVAAHYTVWHYRFDIVKALGRDIIEELEWCDDIALNNQKNYQIWHYRQQLVQLYEDTKGKKFDPKLEWALIETMLVEDNKNYHVWSYRKWLVERYSLYDARELAFADKMLLTDIRNNSAWSHRFFIVVHHRDLDLDAELQFVMKAIALAPQNASPWNYLQGLYKHFNRDLTDLEPFVTKYADIATNNEEPIVQSTHAFEVLAKIYKIKNEKEKSVKIYKLLAERYDPIRVNYWNYLIQRV